MPPRLPLAELTADCSRCTGLCCVLLPFRRDAGFGADKASGVPCHHLLGDDRCEIHTQLTSTGWAGCAVFDCFGAGQQVTEVTYAGASWRDVDDLGEMAAVLSAQRVLHEMLWHLAEVERRSPDPGAADLAVRLEHLRACTPAEVLGADLDALHEECGALLAAASLRVRGRGRPDLTHADLAGRDLRERDLRDTSLRGSVLIGADLRGCELGAADLLGADLRGADLRGADLRDALFTSRPQVAAARTDAATILPPHLTGSR